MIDAVDDLVAKLVMVFALLIVLAVTSASVANRHPRRRLGAIGVVLRLLVPQGVFMAAMLHLLAYLIERISR